MPEPARSNATDSRPEGASKAPRSFWSGTLAFGLVSIPVDLFVGNRSAGVPLHQVTAEGTRLRRRYFCSKEERPLETDEIERGREVEPGRFVTVSDDELDALAPEKSREIDLKRFVPKEQIDPLYYERAYFLVPSQGSTKAYRLLARTLEDSGRAGIATFVMRGREYLVAILGADGLLRAETLRFADEVRRPADIGLPPLPEHVDDRRAQALKRAMTALAADELDRGLLADRDRQRLLALIADKQRRGEDLIGTADDEAATDADEDGGAEIIDLMAILKQGLEDDGDGRDRVSAGDDLETQPKSRLYERAQALDISGRSRMTKAELAAAIRARR